MKIGYADKPLKKLCTVEKVARKRFPAAVVVRLVQHLGLLEAYNCLADIEFQAPPLRFHPLRADYPGCFAVWITPKLRVIFRPAGDVSYLNPNDVDLKSVTEIEVVAIEDYHQ